MNGHDPQCEREIIAQMINSEKSLIKCCSELKPDDFTQIDIRKLFIMANEMYESNEEVNSTSFYVKNKNEIQAMKMGFSYPELFSQFIIEGVEARIARLKECTKARKIIELIIHNIALGKIRGIDIGRCHSIFSADSPRN